jgi:nucleolar protein 56
MKKAYVSANVMGAFAFDEKGKLLDFILFDKNPKLIAERLELIENGKKLDEEEMLIKKLKSKSYEVEQKSNKAEEILQEKFREIAFKTGFAKSDKELNEIIVDTNIIKTKKMLKEEKKEKIMMRVIGIIDYLDKTLNIFCEQMREWYGFYFPEAPKIIKSNEMFTRIVAEGRKENIKEADIKKIAEKSVGMEFSDKDIENIKMFAESLLNFFNVRKKLDSYIKEIAEKEMPNTTAITGHLLAARFVSMAGGLGKLARMPTSRIQLLGAEKALFRHMRSKAKAPKHGIVFAHPYIQQAPKELRGKVARILASKISIAAKTDFFSKEDKSKHLKEELEKEVKKILKWKN